MAVKLPGLCLLLLVLLGLSWAKKHTCPMFATSCEECIRSGPECAWCTALETYTHCNTVEHLQKVGCPDHHIYNPQGSVQLLQDDSSSGEADDSSLFLQPQQVSLHLRPAASQSFTLTISTPADQPIKGLILETSDVPAGFDVIVSGPMEGNPLLVEVYVKAAQCPNKSDSMNQNQTGPWSIQITPRGFSVSLKLEITLQCQCSCTENREENSTACNGFGSQVCGKCYCEKNYTGSHCQHQLDELWTRDERHCRRDDNEPLCSGRGICVEGECECNRRPNPAERYTGVYCQCSNFECPYSNNRICGGHGKCECGKCICDPQWTGESCDCTLETASCLAKNQQICNGRGFCMCGLCRCTDKYFQGPTCEICPACPGKCGQLNKCVDCVAFKMGTDRCDSECGHNNVTMVATQDQLFQKEYKKLCKVYSRFPSCYLIFTVVDDVHTIFAIKDCNWGQHLMELLHSFFSPQTFNFIVLHS